MPTKCYQPVLKQKSAFQRELLQRRPGTSKYADKITVLRYSLRERERERERGNYLQMLRLMYWEQTMVVT